jgi:aspartyl-tRNA(Asn)/glutamyl-tRNA(Gln) amidotransferase subunit A
VGEKTDDPLTMYLSDVFTVPASLAGLPAISVPSGLTRGGLPLGMQLLGPRFGEDAVFAAARAFESGADFPDVLSPVRS